MDRNTATLNNGKVAINFNNLKIIEEEKGVVSVPYLISDNSHSGPRCDVKGVDKTIPLLLFFWEFTGILGIIKDYANGKNIDNFKKMINGLSYQEFFEKCVYDSKAWSNKRIYEQFILMWNYCEDEEIWKEKLNDFRKQYSQHIKKHMDELQAEYGGTVSADYKHSVKVLQEAYGDNWSNYLWQTATFDRIGQFLNDYNSVYNNYNNVALALQNLTMHLPETQQVIKKGDNYKTIDFYCRYYVGKETGAKYAYLDLPDEWVVSEGWGFTGTYKTIFDDVPIKIIKKQIFDRNLDFRIMAKQTDNESYVEITHDETVLCKNRQEAFRCCGGGGGIRCTLACLACK